MAAKKQQATFLIVFMIAAGVVWVIQNRPQTKLGEGAGFEEYADCALVSDRGNDGDSFQVKFPDGEVRHLRLYFVDAPESAVKRYKDGNTNEKRLGHQGKYFSGLSQSETVRVGQEAKQRVNSLLSEAKAFTVFTRGEEVYQSGRIYALVRLDTGEDGRWLHELLVEQGLARIYTMGTNLPDGTSNAAQQRRLHGLEKGAKAARRGAWELASKPNRS